MLQRNACVFCLLSFIGSLSLVSGEETPLDVAEVLTKAVEKARLNEEMANEHIYSYEFVTITETLGKSGDVENVEERSYEAYLVGGVVYERLVAIDGRGLTEDELEQEKEREDVFRKKVAAGKAGQAAGKARRGDSEDRVTFDDALVSRYEMSFVETRQLDGRRCHVLSFVPKAGPLPAGGRFDEVLNNAAGTLCVDAETFEIAHLRFELQEKVSFWWGFLGSVSAMTGELERRPVDSSVWLPQSFDVYMNGRKFWRPVHVHESFVWRDYAKSNSRSVDGLAITTPSRTKW